MKIFTILTTVLTMVGLVLSWFSGWFIYRHDGIIASFARSFCVHEIQAISTAILSIIILTFVIAGEYKRKANIND